jgi:hypothetical protein
MKRSFVLTTLVVCVVGASLIPGTATADPPTKEEFSPVGDQIVCDETLLTVSSGIVVSRTHVHELPSGLFRIISVDMTRDVTATDEEGTVYRLVGGGRANFTTPDPDVETGEEIGFFRFKLNIIGPGGLFGTVDFRIRGKRNGDVIEQDRGTCQFVETND